MEKRSLLYDLIEISKDKIKILEDIQNQFLEILNEEVSKNEKEEIFEELELLDKEISEEYSNIDKFNQDIVNSL